MEAPLYIGCDAGVERPISASDDVDVEQQRQSLCAKVNVHFCSVAAGGLITMFAA